MNDSSVFVVGLKARSKHKIVYNKTHFILPAFILSGKARLGWA
jgi:hypothetical protein